MSWHWAHEATQECDSWSEPDSEWHRWWQAQVPVECREVLRGAHRADIVTPAGLVVEIQSKALSKAEVVERESHYGSMIWIVDCVRPAEEFLERGDRYGLDLRDRGQYHSFRWKHARKWVAHPARWVFLDCGPRIGLLLLRKINLGPPCGGWGNLWSYDRMVEFLNRS